MSRFASSSFTGAPTDELAAVDVYGKVNNETRNAFQSTISAFGQSLEESLGRATSALGEIRDTLNKGVYDPERAKSRLNDVLKSARGQVGKLSETLQSDILGTLGVPLENTEQLRAKINGVVETIEAGDASSASGVVSLLKDITGKNDLVTLIDQEANVSVIQAALSEVSRWGIPGLVDEVLANSSDEVATQAVQRSIRQLNASDIDTIEVLLARVGPSVLTAIKPDFPVQVLRSYRFPKGTTPGDYSERLSQLVDVMDQLMPTWFTTHRGTTDQDVMNLAVINQASDDARLLFISSEPYRTPALIADNYPETSAKALLKRMYPLIAIVEQ